MKSKIFIALLCVFSFNTTSYSQINLNKILKNTKKKTEKKIEKRIESNIDKKVDNTLDEVESGNQKSKDVEENSKTKKNDKKQNQNHKTENETNVSQETSAAAPTMTWNKYDFIPGTEIIFEDNQEREQNGEFPSKWDLAGGIVENAVFDGTNVIYFRETGNQGGISPLVKNAKSDYLPDEFTVEFDCYFYDNVYNQRYYLNFYDMVNQKRVLKKLVFYVNKAEYESSKIIGQYPGSGRSNIDQQAKWRHIAVSFNKRALKVYMDDARLINIPNIDGDPTGITIGTTNQKNGASGSYYVKNVKIAKGAVPLYDKLLTDGKFVTTGIKFDINKSTIKPESYGTINYVVTMMQEHPDLKFSVEGHTDSDGDEAANLKLSEARAKSVMEQLISNGIDKSRLKFKGLGESKPVAENNTPEGKAQNRRVEFVKF